MQNGRAEEGYREGTQEPKAALSDWSERETV